jgi:hypothetical protein
MENWEQKAEQKDLKNLQFSQKRRIFKVVANEGAIAKKIRIKKKPSTRCLEGISGISRMPTNTAQRCKSVDLSFEKRAPGHPCLHREAYDSSGHVQQSRHSETTAAVFQVSPVKLL